MTKYFVARMSDKHASDETIDRAGVALGRIKDPTSVATLVQYVAYERTEVVPTGGGPGAMTTTFDKQRRSQRPRHESEAQDGQALGGMPGRAGCPGYDHRPELRLRPVAWQTWYKHQIASGTPIEKK